MDTTLGAELLSRRGSAERGQFRATPWENTSIRYNYFGLIGREHQGVHERRLGAQSFLPRNWRFVADVNELSSLTFRLAFSDTYGDAINSEVRSSTFLTNNFHGFSFNLASLSDRSFISTNPQTSISTRNAPAARFGSVEQSPFQRLPIYFAFDALAGGPLRHDVGFTPSATIVPFATPHFFSPLGVAPPPNPPPPLRRLLTPP